MHIQVGIKGPRTGPKINMIRQIKMEHITDIRMNIAQPYT